MNLRFWKLIGIGAATFAVIAGAIWYFAWRPLRFVDRARGFSIRFGPEWLWQGEGEGAHARATRALGVQGGGPRGVISVFVGEIRDIPDDFAFRSWWTQIPAKNFKNYERLGEGTRRLGDRETPWILYTHLDPDAKTTVKSWQFFQVRERRGYVITCVSTPEAFEEFRPEFEEAVDSFRLE